MRYCEHISEQEPEKNIFLWIPDKTNEGTQSSWELPYLSQEEYSGTAPASSVNETSLASKQIMSFVSTHLTKINEQLDHWRMALSNIDPFEILIGDIKTCHLSESATTPSGHKRFLGESIKRLISNGKIEEARNLLNQHIGSNERIDIPDHWRSILSPPVTRKSDTATGGRVRENEDWLKNNAHKYKKCWVALRDGHLVGFSFSRRVITQELLSAQNNDKVLVFRIPG